MDRTAALELAASLPKGDPVRRKILARLKGATSVALPRVPSGGPDQDWYDRAINAVERDRTVEARGLENKVLMMAWDLGYELASGGDDRYYRGEYEKLRLLAEHLGLGAKAEKEWKSGTTAYGKYASSKTAGRALDKVYSMTDTLHDIRREFPGIHKERVLKDLQKALYAFEDVVSKHELAKYGES